MNSYYLFHPDLEIIQEDDSKYLIFKNSLRICKINILEGSCNIEDYLYSNNFFHTTHSKRLNINSSYGLTKIEAEFYK